MDGSGCEQQSETGWKSVEGMSVTRRYLLLPISHGSISIKFITVFAANVANGSVRYLLRSAAADGSFRSPLPPRRFISSSIRFIFLPLRDIAYYDPYTRPLCASFRELFPTGGRDISVDCLMTDLATDVSSWNSSGDHSYLTFPGARFFFFLISFFFFNWNNRQLRDTRFFKSSI